MMRNAETPSGECQISNSQQWMVAAEVIDAGSDGTTHDTACILSEPTLMKKNIGDTKDHCVL